jgi:hypothetical protein
VKYFTLKNKDMSEHSFDTEIEKAQVEVTFDFQPEEPVVMYYPDGSGDPGCPASIDYIQVMWKTTEWNKETRKKDSILIDITDLIEELGYDMEDECWSHLESYNPD